MEELVDLNELMCDLTVIFEGGIPYSMSVTVEVADELMGYIQVGNRATYINPETAVAEIFIDSSKVMAAYISNIREIENGDEATE